MKTALIVDVSNLYFAINRLHPNKRLMLLDYVKHLEEAGHDLAFKIVYSRQSPNSAQSFTHMLHCHGFETHFGTGPWAVEMALRASEILPSVEWLVLGSNSKELHPIFRFARKEGKRTKCFAVDIPQDARRVAEAVEIPTSILVTVPDEPVDKAKPVAVSNHGHGNGA